MLCLSCNPGNDISQDQAEPDITCPDDHIITVREALELIDIYRRVPNEHSPNEEVSGESVPGVPGSLAGTYDLCSLEAYINGIKSKIDSLNKANESKLVFSGLRYYFGARRGPEDQSRSRLTTVVLPGVYDENEGPENVRSLLMELTVEQQRPVYLENVISLVRQDKINVFNPDTVDMRNPILRGVFIGDARCAYNRSQMCPPNCCCQ